MSAKSIKFGRIGSALIRSKVIEMLPPLAALRDTRSGSGSGHEGEASANFPFAREAAWSHAPSAVYSTFGGGISILNLGTGRYFRLEGVGEQIWDALAYPITVEAIAAVIAADYAIGQATAEETVSSFVDSLRGAGLVVAS